MMEQSHVETILMEYLQSRQAVMGTVETTTDLIEAGHLDSLSLLDLVLFMQTSFQIEVAPRDVSPANFRSIQTLSAWIANRLAAPGKAA